VFRSREPLREATCGPRPVGAAFAATMQPPERIVLATQLRGRLGADAWLASGDDAAGDAQRIIRRAPRCVVGFGRVCTFESWMELLGATRWCIDREPASRHHGSAQSHVRRAAQRARGITRRSTSPRSGMT